MCKCNPKPRRMQAAGCRSRGRGRRRGGAGRGGGRSGSQLCECHLSVVEQAVVAMATLIQENGIKELSKGTHSIANHMVPDHEYCEPKPEPAAPAECAAPADDEDTPEIDIMINNVVCSFSVKCHLNLRQIALNGVNVEFRRENGMVTMKLRRPYTTASIWSSGRITCTGATSEEQARVAARRYARALQKLGFQVRFQNFRVVNVLGTCRMPFGIRITAFSNKYREADYEPELHPGVTYKLYNPKATLKIFSTGGVTITARSVCDVQSAVERIFPLVYEFRKMRTPEDEELFRQKRAAAAEAAGAGAAAAAGAPVTQSDDEGGDACE
ncbi:hypothetical protein MSG28_002433 [Choristoneura fumiferana]|uniref:Uncharacterized protein n=1 Tax=Choristoneura fumiferana TaxID=7141 RepID=A0ACC0JVX8_CHOFU|nr:hypothetical protein MSG28_002433 [Choristoneura fumiferana]